MIVALVGLVLALAEPPSLQSSLWVGSQGITCKSEVKKLGKEYNDEWFYKWTLTNNSKEDELFVRWSILDFGPVMLVKLKPGETEKFTMQNKHQPKEKSGAIEFWKMNGNILIRQAKGKGFGYVPGKKKKDN